MEKGRNEIRIHPELLEVLFAYRSKVSSVFRDVLGIHEIDHVAFTRISKDKQLLTLSSTPSLEFNLFNSQLWRFDKTYKPQWFQLCTQDHWQNLYSHSRYDELYYLKQIKHAYPLGINLAAQIDEEYIIYSIASKKSCTHTRDIFATQHDDFYKMGQYCANRLNSIFDDYDNFTTHTLPILAEYV
jgi:hypothetical protein